MAYGAKTNSCHRKTWKFPADKRPGPDTRRKLLEEIKSFLDKGGPTGDARLVVDVEFKKL